MRARLVGTAVVWVLAVLLWLTGALDVVHAAMLAAAVTAIVLAWPGDLPAPPELPPAPDRKAAGERPEVARLSWRLRDADDRISPRVIALVRDLAADESLRQRIDSTPVPSRAQVMRWLDAIDSQSTEQGAR
jgi:hypothetical protein